MEKKSILTVWILCSSYVYVSLEHVYNIYIYITLCTINMLHCYYSIRVRFTKTAPWSSTKQMFKLLGPMMYFPVISQNIFVVVFWNRVSLHIPGSPWTNYADWAGLSSGLKGMQYHAQLWGMLDILECWLTWEGPVHSGRSHPEQMGPEISQTTQVRWWPSFTASALSYLQDWYS